MYGRWVSWRQMMAGSQHCIRVHTSKNLVWNLLTFHWSRSIHEDQKEQFGQLKNYDIFMTDHLSLPVCLLLGVLGLWARKPDRDSLWSHMNGVWPCFFWLSDWDGNRKFVLLWGVSIVHSAAVQNLLYMCGVCSVWRRHILVSGTAGLDRYSSYADISALLVTTAWDVVMPGIMGGL